MATSRRSRRARDLTLVAVALTAAGLLYRNWTDVDAWLVEQGRYTRYRFGDDPVQRDLAAGRIKPGDDMEEVIARYPPDSVTRTEHYTSATYGGGFEGTAIVAKDGRVASAGVWSCTFQDTFFDTLTADDHRAAADEREHEHTRRLLARRDARMGVAGFAVIAGDDQSAYGPPPAVDEP